MPRREEVAQSMDAFVKSTDGNEAPSDAVPDDANQSSETPAMALPAPAEPEDASASACAGRLAD